MNDGLVMAPRTPRARSTSRTSVVLPVPRSPSTVTSAGGRSSAASTRANFRVWAGEARVSEII